MESGIKSDNKETGQEGVPETAHLLFYAPKHVIYTPFTCLVELILLFLFINKNSFMADNPIDIQALARGDEKAFQALFVEYYPALVSFGCRYVVSKETAEDIVQDVFVRIWETRESLAKIEDLSAYLYQMVRFRCFNHLRDAKTHSDALRDYAENMPTEDMNNYIKEESFRLAMKALEDLPPASRQVFSHMLDGLSAQEIAKKLNIAVETVKTHKQIARRILKEKLGRLYLFLF